MLALHTYPCLCLVWVPTSLPMCPQALQVNGLEQLCNNLASERLQLFSNQLLLAQEEVKGTWACMWQEAPRHFPEQRALNERSAPKLPCPGPSPSSEPHFTHL